MILHGYFRSSASWRVRIALGLKGIEVDHEYHHLRKGDQRAPDYLEVNPQGLVPALVLGDGTVLTQSLAIVEYLDEIAPEPPLLPAEPEARAKVRAVAQLIACDVHPVQNLKILDRVRTQGGDEAANEWARTVIAEGLGACEALIAEQSGPFCFGEAPSLADVVLIPQLGNAHRFGVDMWWPRIAEVERACQELDAFSLAAPDQQPDHES
jgi:maleylpyruvate isomerase